MHLIACHMFAGFSGVVVAVAIPAVLRMLLCALTDENEICTFEPKGEGPAGGPGSFEPRLANYVHIAEYVIGLATGSLVLAAGSSILRKAGALDWHFASPLTLLGASVIFGVCFIAFLTYYYEAFLHDAKCYARSRYNFVTTLGFSALLSFAVGYMWLALIITKAG